MSLVIVHQTGSQSTTATALYLAEFLRKEVSTHPTLLLLSGGSAISMYQQLFQQLVDSTWHAPGLSVSLLDERFVDRNSPDSNAVQLEQAGVLALLAKLGASWIPYLEHEQGGADVATKISHTFAQCLDAGKKLIIFAGVGDDGHTAGLLPTQDPTTIREVFESSELVRSYELPSDAVNPFRHRITSTPALITQATHIMMYATGEKKRPVLQKFIDGTGEVPAFPALCLRQGPAQVTLLTDLLLDK